MKKYWKLLKRIGSFIGKALDILGVGMDIIAVLAFAGLAVMVSVWLAVEIPMLGKLAAIPAIPWAYLLGVHEGAVAYTVVLLITSYFVYAAIFFCIAFPKITWKPVYARLIKKSND